ncbi:hypothetical protein DSLASN_21070 [Desulfoluna limicola]|uniref:Oligosaccharide repeat unit polymerase n=1 Tax=Desulfoluna limicola TaxID=2810562 RepID=A0ABM7PH07_9BACT|nr:hypothetical protein [Desulfoluna limicola]BCS96475.1 hypothetical protein DSLASN_21070 [Desulfoluna limicola]
MNNIVIILTNKIIIYLISLLLVIVIACFFKNKKLATSSLLINWPSVVGLSSLIYLVVVSTTLYSAELTSIVIVVEIVLLFFSTYLMYNLMLKIRFSIEVFSLNSILIKLLVIFCLIKLFIIIPNLGTYGIFSNGSRIKYLSNGTVPLLLTYLSTVVNSSIMISIGTRIYINRISKLDFVTVFVAFVFSLVAGSKGAVFLSVIYMFLFAWGLGYRFTKIHFINRVVYVILFAASIGLYLSLLAKFSDTSFQYRVNISLARFILSSDARALASDSIVRELVLSNTHGSLLSEIFKGIAIKLNAPVSDIPLGVAQYAAVYNINSYTGANAGLSSLILTYFNSYLDLFSIGLSIIFVLVIVGIGFLTYSLSRRPFQKMISMSFLFTFMLNFVQDYQAFFITAVLLFVWMVYIFCWRFIFEAINYMPHIEAN